MEQLTFQVTGLHCQGCVNTVSAALRDIDVVGAVEVDLAAAGPSTVRVQATGPLTVNDVRNALRDDEEFLVLS